MREKKKITRVIYLLLSGFSSYYQQIASNWYSMLFLGGLALWKQLLRANDLKLVECFASEQKNIVETAKRDKHQVPKQTRYL